MVCLANTKKAGINKKVGSKFITIKNDAGDFRVHDPAIALVSVVTEEFLVGGQLTRQRILNNIQVKRGWNAASDIGGLLEGYGTGIKGSPAQEAFPQSIRRQAIVDPRKETQSQGVCCLVFAAMGRLLPPQLTPLRWLAVR
jgi:hypothetical protein